jgi:hypothetical protein
VTRYLVLTLYICGVFVLLRLAIRWAHRESK